MENSNIKVSFEKEDSDLTNKIQNNNSKKHLARMLRRTENKKQDKLEEET